MRLRGNPSRRDLPWSQGRLGDRQPRVGRHHPRAIVEEVQGYMALHRWLPRARAAMLQEREKDRRESVFRW